MRARGAQPRRRKGAGQRRCQETRSGRHDGVPAAMTAPRPRAENRGQNRDRVCPFYLAETRRSGGGAGGGAGAGRAAWPGPHRAVREEKNSRNPPNPPNRRPAASPAVPKSPPGVLLIRPTRAPHAGRGAGAAGPRKAPGQGPWGGRVPRTAPAAPPGSVPFGDRKPAPAGGPGLNDVLEDPHGAHDVPVLPGRRRRVTRCPRRPAVAAGVTPRVSLNEGHGVAGTGVAMPPTPPRSSPADTCPGTRPGSPRRPRPCPSSAGTARGSRGRPLSPVTPGGHAEGTRGDSRTWKKISRCSAGTLSRRGGRVLRPSMA